MIKSLSVQGLNNRINADLEFNEDLNIITGKNGSGKTTLLKLLWYLISGNLGQIVHEIPFQDVSIQTDSFSLLITRMEPDKIRVISEFSGEEKTEGTGSLEQFEEGFQEELSRKIRDTTKRSLFFPTFRRIEGGFSGRSSFFAGNIIIAGFDRFHTDRPKGRFTDRATERLQDAMSQLSTDLSADDHKFVASISTLDIVELLREKYADVFDKTNDLHVQLSNEISQIISNTKRDDNETSVLEDIKKRVEQDAVAREALFKPFSVLTERIRDILQYKGIRVSSVITLGEAEEAIVSDKLSSGEKQMLSFLCYNTFSENTTIFIDEPELSLHVDWQRILLPTLLEQETENQFFFATHSPFIYAKYPKKEIPLETIED